MPHKAEEAVDRRSQSTSQRPADRADPSAMETTWRRTAVLDEDPRMDGCCETSRRQEDKEWLSKRGLVSSVFLPRPSDQGDPAAFSGLSPPFGYMFGGITTVHRVFRAWSPACRSVWASNTNVSESRTELPVGASELHIKVWDGGLCDWSSICSYCSL